MTAAKDQGPDVERMYGKQTLAELKGCVERRDMLTWLEMGELIAEIERLQERCAAYKDQADAHYEAAVKATSDAERMRDALRELIAALRRIGAINDNPFGYNVEINHVVTAAVAQAEAALLSLSREREGERSAARSEHPMLRALNITRMQIVANMAGKNALSNEKHLSIVEAAIADAARSEHQSAGRDQIVMDWMQARADWDTDVGEACRTILAVFIRSLKQEGGG